jgi:sulfur-oxidizing protein SoxX
MMKMHLFLAGLLMLSVLPGCNPSPKSSRGFQLPDGNAANGQQAFVDLKCNTCHKVAGVDLPAPSAFNLTLGGKTARVKTYGELVTSIINPSHVVSEPYKSQLEQAKLSPMPEFNCLMTVEQMIDLVAFLQPHYELVQPKVEPNYYP